ncbi:MAG: cysteine--tRNA ligase [Erysipelotrichaceae bacterium]|nr:cysteine--tRNA ligase [Erysipelotrichaceae bacterium]
MKELRIYNTKTLQNEVFKPLKEGEVKMYVCGPTVYGDIHIGNARPVVVFDTFRRLLEAIGYDVKYVSNYTDVDDKIIKEAKRRGITEKQLTEEMIEAFQKVRKDLNTEPLYRAPKVTETMDQIIAFIKELVDKGYAYEVSGDVYFDTSSVASYGELSHQNTEDLKVGARIDENEQKRSPLDFALWKKTDEGIKWESPFCLGRPGWHTECVVMINNELGPLIDIHGGGKDLRFPHHENERAQSMAINNSELANYWMHNGMLTFGGEKMSKSLGNIILAKDAIAKHGANVVRWLLLSGQYRDSLSFTEETLDIAANELNKVLNAVKSAELKLVLADYHSDEFDQESYDRFLDAMLDDLNTPNAYTEIYEMTKVINQLQRVREIDYDKLAKDLNSLLKSLDILGIVYPKLELSEEDLDLYHKWDEAKKAKDFEKADAYRQQLMDKGIL